MLSAYDPPAPVSKYLRVWIGIAFIAILLRALHLAATQAHPSDLFVFNNRALRVVTSWSLYPALLPSIFWTARRFPLDPPHVMRDAIVHMVCVGILAFVHMIAVSFLTLGFSPSMQNFLGWYFPLDLIAYWAGICALHYYYEVQDRKLIAERLRADLTEVQLRALRSQLNPHFLYNTLNTISALALTNDSAGVMSVVTRLSALLRRTLDDGAPQETGLAQEIEAADDYVQIQLVRFGERLVVEWDVAPDTLQASVPSMILQPLIENAIKHGIAAHCGSGIVTVRSRVEAHELVVQVRNTVAPGAAPVSRVTSMGIGLTNTRSRLRHLYGEAQRLDYGRTPGGGVSVTIAVPFRRISDERAVA